MEASTNPSAALGRSVAAPPRPSSSPCPGSDDVLKALEKVLTSRTFQPAEGQRKFLRYVVEQKLAGRSGHIKEYSVGVEVFGREESFDPRSSSIVRSEARKLRARLAKYYESEGEHDPVRIDFPKGGYVPGFQSASAAVADVSAEDPAAIPVAEPLPAHPLSSNGHAALHPSDAAPSERPIAENAASEASAIAPAAETLARRRFIREAATRRSAVVILSAIALAAIATVFLVRGRGAGNSTADPASIVVLPFSNLSDPKDDAFSDGLTEELIDSLTRVPGLHVVARTSSFRYKGKTEDIRDIGRELNVRTVLAGSVRRYGGRLRIAAQLNDASNGYNLWSESYDRDLQDALRIQREISEAIVASLGSELPAKSGAGAPREASVNPDAYLEYLQGLYYRNRASGENLKLALGHFQTAIAKDPNYAAAYAGIARCYVELPIFTPTLARDVISNIRLYAAKADALDSSQNEAHLTLAWGLVYDYDWHGAEQEFRRAVSLAPGSVDVHREYGHFLQREGRVDEALAEGQKAMSLDPLSPRAIQALARGYYFERRYDQAVEQYQRALALDPNAGVARQALGLAYAVAKKYPQALAETQAAHQIIGGPLTTAQTGYIDALAGNPAAARAILHQFLAGSGRPTAPALAIAQVYVGLGENAQAIEWLRKAVDQHDANLDLKSDPLYDPLRSDPRFAELLHLSKLD